VSLAAPPAPPATAPPAEIACLAALCGARALTPVFDALAARSALNGAPPVHILQIGDSHSAGDAISGAWRDILQGRYGAGGRGVLPPGSPYWGFLPHGVHVSQSAGWRVEATFGAAAPADPGAVFGISGFRLSAAGAGASIALAAEPRAAFSRAIVCAVTGPGAGSYALVMGGETWRVALAGPPGAACRAFEAAGLQLDAALTTEGGPVTLLSWATFRPGGVTLSNLGVVGAQLRHFARADDDALAEEFRAYAPDLIVLEFGTNEGFSGRFDGPAYESLLRGQIARLKRLSGGAPILILGAPDAETDRRALAHNAEPLPGEALSIGSGPRAAGGWFEPPALARTRDIQRRVAAEAGVAFWDWAMRMGGDGTAQDWATRAPPLMRGDRVHYTAEGGAEIARRLQADLDAAAAATAAPP
jgi:lysophospholipase L1-like esterase